MKEIELKFDLETATSAALWPRVKAFGLERANPTTKTLRSIYLDTSGHALRKAGIALRLRHDGESWTQTVKVRARLHGGLSQAGEAESPAPEGRLCLEAIPDASLRDAVLRHVNGAALQPVCETVIDRCAGELSLEGGARAELAVDAGKIHANGHSADLYEAEIELIDGSSDALFDVARKLFPDGGFRFSRLSKAARGYLLAEEGRSELPVAPRSSRAVALVSAHTAGEALQNILRECLDQIAVNMVVVQERDDPEGPHQLRIGLRRLRSAFSVFSPLLRGAGVSTLRAEARWLGRQLGRLRDLDVILNDIVKPAAATHPDEAGFVLLAEALFREAAEVRAETRALLAQGRAHAFLLDLSQLVEAYGRRETEERRFHAPVSKYARRALDLRWKAAHKRAPGLENLEIEQRHELRKELKKLRYAAEFFAPLYPVKRVDPFLKSLKSLQSILGDLNDAATLKALLTGAGAPGTDDPSAQRAAGWLIGAGQTRADYGWSGVKSLWRKFERTPPFWK